ncbi:MAG: cupin domain-containing protein [candidate division WOR-3 bacterium]
MLKGHFLDVAAEKSPMPGTDATIRWLISKREGAPNFAMRLIELAGRGERIPLHEHTFEHEMFVIAGTGRLLQQNREEPVTAGDYIFVPAGEQHGFVNEGDSPFRFICVVPNSADTRQQGPGVSRP